MVVPIFFLINFHINRHVAFLLQNSGKRITVVVTWLNCTIKGWIYKHKHI